LVQWNGGNLVTKVGTDSNNNILYLTATVPAALLAKSGTAAVNTINPHSGSTDNGLSNTITFIINPPPNPLPVLTGINPTSIGQFSTKISLTVNGSSFLPTAGMCPGTQISTQSEVDWNAGGTQTALTTFTSISATQIQLLLPDSLFLNQGTAIVTVRNPPACPVQTSSGVINPYNGGGGSSNAANFAITNAAPTHNVVSAQLVAEETPALGQDGRYVAYTAAQGGHSQIFLHDTCTGAASDCQPRTTLLSAAGDGAAGNGDSNSPSMSADGRFVAFSSAATNLVPSVPAGRQIYWRDTCSGATAACAPQTILVSADESGALAGSDNLLPSVSSSGRFIAFLSVTPSNYPAPSAESGSGTPNSGYRQIFVRDTCFGAAVSCTPKTTRLSLLPGDTNVVPGKPAGPAISGSAHAVGVSSVTTPTLFTRSVPVGDRVFLALTQK